MEKVGGAPCASNSKLRKLVEKKWALVGLFSMCLLWFAIGPLSSDDICKMQALPFRFSQERKVQTFREARHHVITYQTSTPFFLLQICDERLHHQLGIKFHIEWTPFGASLRLNVLITKFN